MKSIVKLEHERSQGEDRSIIFDLLASQPGLDRRQLAKEVGISVPGVVWHMERLAGAGLVGSDRLGRRIRYFARETALVYDADKAVEVA